MKSSQQKGHFNMSKTEKNKKDQRIPIIVSEELKEKLTIEADKQGIPLSVLGRTLFIQWYKEQTKEK